MFIFGSYRFLIIFNNRVYYTLFYAFITLLLPLLLLLSPHDLLLTLKKNEECVIFVVYPCLCVKGFILIFAATSTPKTRSPLYCFVTRVNFTVPLKFISCSFVFFHSNSCRTYFCLPWICHFPYPCSCFFPSYSD